MSDDGTVNIHGKTYLTVARRVQDFREDFPNYGIKTKVLCAGELVQVKATITSDCGRVLATGLAEELRGSTNINKTSALENAETSAVGRALSFLGYGGTEIASADEVANAITQQKELEMVNRLKAHNDVVRDNLESIAAIKAYLVNEEYENAYEALAELSEEERKSLWVATTAGGIWTTEERAKIKSNEMNAARKSYHGEAA